MQAPLLIRTYQPTDAQAVRDLFLTVTRELVPDHMGEARDTYLAHALTVELDRIEDYYAEHAGGFWVAYQGNKLVGMFGLEKGPADAMELRRMYVAAADRRAGVGSAMLRFAEAECRTRGVGRMALSTSELQPAALAFYERAGYMLVGEQIALSGSNKTLGAGIRRFAFEKRLDTVKPDLT